MLCVADYVKRLAQLNIIEHGYAVIVTLNISIGTRRGIERMCMSYLMRMMKSTSLHMAIETVKLYYPKMKHPVYARLALPERNDYTVFNEYEIRVPDQDNGEDGPYNYIHEAVLIAKTVCKWSKVPDILKAYVANTRDADEALERIHPRGSDGSFDADDEVVILVFLRKERAKEMIMSDEKIIDPQSLAVSSVDDNYSN